MMQPIISASASESSSTNATGSALDRMLVRGLAWTGAVKWLGQLLSWVSTIVVARLLSPEDYGIVAMAGVFIGFIGILNEFGLGAAVVALRHLYPCRRVLPWRLHGQPSPSFHLRDRRPCWLRKTMWIWIWI